MTDTRLLVLSEDYGEACLVMTDCINEKLKAILEKAEENDENGIGQSVEEICKELFPYNFMVELASTEESKYSEIKDLDTLTLVSTNYLTFSVVQCKTE